MNILGLADGTDAGAALLVDDHVVAVVEQERLNREPHTRAFPWDAALAALEVAGLTPHDVDMVAIAGRFSPPFFLRRHPELRRFAKDAYSPLLDATVFYQALLRQTGLGALEADRTAEWFDRRLRERGYGMRRTLLVDVHRCLAEAAHRTQSTDPVLVMTVHPSGDGVGIAAYRGSGGQLDRLWAQKGFASLHVHMKRCLAAIDVPKGDEALAWSLAQRAEADPALVVRLNRMLHSMGPGLSRKRYPFPERRKDYSVLKDVPVEVAAASLLQNMADAVCDVVRHHARAWGLRSVALGGGVFENPWLVARVAALPEVDHVWTPPLQGWASLALGAAASVGGMAPGLLQGPGLGTDATPDACAAALPADVTVTPCSAGEVADLLLSGKAVARCQGRGGFGRHGGGTRSVLALPNAEAVEVALRALGRDPREGAVLARRQGAATGLDGPLRHGAAAAMGPLGLCATAEVREGDDPGLIDVIEALEAKGGMGAVALLPLGCGLEPAAERPVDAVSVFQRSTLEALWLGPNLVRR